MAAEDEARKPREARKARRECEKALAKEIPVREELEKALDLAAEYGFSDVTREVRSRGYHGLLRVKKETSQGGGRIVADGGGGGGGRIVADGGGGRGGGIAADGGGEGGGGIVADDGGEESVAQEATDPIAAALHRKCYKDAMTMIEMKVRWKLRDMSLRKKIQEVIVDEAREEYGFQRARIKLLQTILNKTLHDGYEDPKLVVTHTIHGTHVDATILVEGEEEDSESVDGSSSDANAQPTIYETIARSSIRELKSHPCFAAVVNKKWESSYHQYLHWSLLIIFLLFMASLTTSLVLAARSSSPTHYHGVAGGVQGFCEAFTLLYILMGAAINAMKTVYHIKKLCNSGRHTQSSSNPCGNDKNLENGHNHGESISKNPENCSNTHRHGDYKLKLIRWAWKYVIWQSILDFCGTVFILLIIPLRVTGSEWQWLFASLAIGINGFRIFFYFTVLSDIGRYVATLAILIKRDLLWIIGVFLVLNFSLGGALYFALVGHNFASLMRNNDTSEIYQLWAGGFHIVTGAASDDPGTVTWLTVSIHWFFVFTISTIFLSIVFAQFTTTFNECSAEAQVNVILNKCEIMLRNDDTFSILERMCGCCKYLKCKTTKQECYELLKTPYTPDEVDFRPVSVLKMEEKHNELMKGMQEMKLKFDKTAERVEVLQGALQAALQSFATATRDDIAGLRRSMSVPNPVSKQ